MNACLLASRVKKHSERAGRSIECIKEEERSEEKEKKNRSIYKLKENTFEGEERAGEEEGARGRAER